MPNLTNLGNDLKWGKKNEVPSFTRLSEVFNRNARGRADLSCAGCLASVGPGTRAPSLGLFYLQTAVLAGGGILPTPGAELPGIATGTTMSPSPTRSY